MRVLHTSDWHLGRSLFGQKRYEEFSAFLDWLARTLQEKEVDVLVVSGDIFDSGTPSNRAQRLYYDFLRQVYLSSCRHVVITAGNHDSPSMLGASREILQVLDVHVVGNLPEDPAEEIKVLRDAQGKVALIVCAVPFLRDADMRLVEEGESSGDKESKMQEAAGTTRRSWKRRRRCGTAWHLTSPCSVWAICSLPEARPLMAMACVTSMWARWRMSRRPSSRRASIIWLWAICMCRSG